MRLTIPSAIVLVASLIDARSLTAQQPAAAPPPRKEGPVISVQFPGGTLDDYIKAVQKAAAPTPVNVIRADSAGAIQLPAVILKDVSPGTALEAVEWIFRGDDRQRFDVSDFRSDDQGSDVYAVTFVTRSPPSNPVSGQADGRAIEVISIRDLIEPAERRPEVAAVAVTRDNVLSAVESALRMNRAQGAEAPEVLFHEDTGLVIVRGSGEDIDIARSVVLRIREDVARRREKADDAGRDIRVFEQELRKTEATLGVKHREFQILNERFERARKMKEAGTESDERVQAAEIERARAELDLQLLEVQRDQLMQQLNERQAAREARAELKAAIYDIADLSPAATDLQPLASALVQGSGGSAEVKPGEGGKGLTLVVKADASGQDLIAGLLRTIRKAAGRPAPGDQRGGAR